MSRRDELIRSELKAHAALLFRLGYPSQRAKLRLRANLQWDEDLCGKSKHERDIDRIVDAIYRRGGAGSSPAKD